MRILVAPDKFKDSLGAADVAENIAAGLRLELPRAEIVLLPISDGGEGFASVICGAEKGTWNECAAQDALGRTVHLRYGTIDGGTVAIMEMSEAAGLWRLKAHERDPLRATSFGVGQMLLDAVRRGVREIIIGLGGSATNDGGFGMARALGFRFFDGGRQELAEVAQLSRVAGIERPRELRLPPITAAADVRNYLLGKNGATRIFGPQKGATPEQIELLEVSLRRLADVVVNDFGVDHRDVPGAGAAGGLGFGLMSFCDAKLRFGFEVMAEQIGLEEAVRKADIIITGEGRLDAQTLEGKAPAAVARLARKFGKKVFAIVGSAELSPQIGGIFDDILPLSRTSAEIEYAMSNAPELVRMRAREVARRYFFSGGKGD